MIRKSLKIFFFVLLFLGVATGIGLYWLNQHLASNKTKILQDLPFLHGGNLTFNELEFSIFENFPAASFIFHDVVLKDSLFDQHQISTAQIDELHLQASLHQLWFQKIRLQAIRLVGGSAHLFTDTSGYNNLDAFFQQTTQKENGRWYLPKIYLEAPQIGVLLEDLRITISDDLRTSRHEGTIRYLETNLDFQKEIVASKFDAQIDVDSLVFKQQNGAFLRNTKLAGAFQIVQKDSLLEIPPFDLDINREPYVLNVQIPTKAKAYSKLVLRNKKTDLKRVLPLLPNKLQRAILPYRVKGEFASTTTIQTNFQSGTLPVISVDFQLKNQQVFVHGFEFKRTYLSGRFINRFYDDDRQKAEPRKRFRVLIDNVATQFKDFNIRTPHLRVFSKNRKNTTIRTKAVIKGAPKAISDWFENDQFFFEDGTFELQADINGQLGDLKNIVLNSNANLELSDFSVWYAPAKLTLPFSQMSLQKEVGDAYFKLVNSTFVEGYDLHADGALKNLPALMLNLANEQASSTINLSAKQLNWTDFVNIFGEKGWLKKDPSTSQKKKRKMKAVLRGMYDKFLPELKIFVDTLAYFDKVKLVDFETGVRFKNRDTIVLENTKFNYGEGTVNLSGLVDISQPNITPFEVELSTNQLNLRRLLPSLNYLNINLLKNIGAYPKDLTLRLTQRGILDDEKGLIPNTSTGEISFLIDGGETLVGSICYQPDTSFHGAVDFEKSYANTSIELEGIPSVFNNFFKTEAFFFGAGHFKVAFDYKGNLGTSAEIMSNGNATLSLEDSEVLYQPVGVTFPLTEIDLSLANDNADFEFLLASEALPQPLQFQGKMEHISELLIGNTGQDLTSVVDVSSKKMVWKNLLGLFDSQTTSSGNSASMKATVLGLLKRFGLTFHVAVDTFVYNPKIVIENLSSGVHLQDSTEMILENTNFEIHEGHVFLNGQFNIGRPLMTPFSSYIRTDNLNLQQLVESLNYLALPSLRNLDKLEGRINIDLKLSGIIDDNGSRLIENATDGQLAFNLEEVVLVGLEPLDKIASRLRMENRFQALHFAPITGSIVVKGQEIEFPLLEIQSNAIHLFMEGTLSYGDLTNMWVSIPLNNLKRADRSIIPEKTGYAAAKRKAHIEVTSDELGENQFRLRLTKRKFYKHRAILEQYRRDKKRHRAVRKALRKNKRLTKRKTLQEKLMTSKFPPEMPYSEE
ncbi:MAG: hypothetical protein AAF960_23200 [Bacteroidota bacterium]